MTYWRKPRDKTGIKLLVKTYLDKKGVLIKGFEENYPGDDWAALFMKRHDLTQRLAENVHPARTKVNADVLTIFLTIMTLKQMMCHQKIFAILMKLNVTNEPGTKKVICRKGIKRLERKIDHSKASVSLMYSGFADGNLLPPMVIYKSNHVYENWCVDGPAGTVYDCTTSGWFDIRTFEVWFFKLYLPEASKKQGKKLLIGDNLSLQHSMASYSNPVYTFIFDNQL